MTHESGTGSKGSKTAEAAGRSVGVKPFRLPAKNDRWPLEERGGGPNVMTSSGLNGSRQASPIVHAELVDLIDRHNASNSRRSCSRFRT